MFPTRDEPWFGSFVRDQVEDLQGLGIDLRVVHFDARRRVLNYARAARDVRRTVVKENFDIVHAHYGLTGAVAVLQRRTPVVTTFHGSDYNGWVPWQRYVSWVVARRSFPVVVSEEGRRSLGRPSAPIVPCGVDLELFRPTDRVRARGELGWRQDGRYVLLPGSRANRRKRPDLFDATLEEARKAVPDLEGVSLDGYSREQVALAFNAADVTLMTSAREGAPVAVRESLACMTPVISVSVGDVEQVLAGLSGCGIYPSEPGALARGVLGALATERHPDLRHRAERDSRRRVAERLAALYESVLQTEKR